GDRPDRGYGRPAGERRFADRGPSDRERGERRFGDRDDRRFTGHRGAGERDAQGDRRFDDRPTGGRGFDDRPADGRRFGDRDGRGDRRFGERGGDFRTPERRGGFRPDGRGRDDRRGFGGRPPVRAH
ncbi:RNA helicase, partial [Micromonospora sp. PPF5-17]